MTNTELTDLERKQVEVVEALYHEAKELGLTDTSVKIANMNITEITVPDAVIKAILKVIHLNQAAQEEVMDKLVERTPGYFQLSAEESVAKLTTALTMETTIEFLRMVEAIKTDVDMLESGIDDKGAIVIKAYYVDKSGIDEKVFGDEMTEEQVDLMEKEINLFNTDVDILAEAKKRIEKKNNVVPFQNREERRLAKARRAKK